MRTIRQVAAIAAIAAVAALATSGTGLTAPSSCGPPPSPDSAGYYDFVHTYRSECATTSNYERTFSDVTASTLVDQRNRLAVTTSTALAGAVASVKVNGKEFIASGGKGSALQYAFHAWQTGGAASECYNPTQGGARIDIENQQIPFHGPSTSALYTMTGTGTSVRTESMPAMFMTRADPKPGWDGCFGADFQPDRRPFTQGLSPYWLQTQVQLAPDHEAPALSNVVRVAATLTSDDTPHDNFDGVLVAYLQRDFTNVFSYDLATGAMSPRPAKEYASKQPLVRCTADEAYCLGMYVRPQVLGTAAYYYTMTRPPSDYNGMTGEFTIQVTSPTTNVRNGNRLDYETFLAVGNKQRVSDTMRELHGALGAE